MTLSKKQRLEVWNKSNGLCWYCGNDLPEKGWHADHFKPIWRQGDVVWKVHNDVIENIVPSCAPCNLFKSVFDVEQFRNELTAQVDRARKSSVNFRNAERFGMIEIKNEPIKFWFENYIAAPEDKGE